MTVYAIITMANENEHIQIHRTKEDLIYQLSCIKQLQNFNNRREYGAVGLGILIITAFAVGVNLFSPPDVLIELKGVVTFLTAICWAIALPLCLWLLARSYRTSLWIKSSVKQTLAGGEEYFVSFNEEGITHCASSYKTELKWTYFHHYLESPSAIFLFDKNSPFGFISFTANEIGMENLERLKAIVKQNIPVLNEDIVLK